MMAAAYLARRQGRIPGDLVDLHRGLLRGLGLPVTGRFDLPGLRQAWLRDKKFRDGTRFVLLNGLGRPEARDPGRRRQPGRRDVRPQRLNLSPERAVALAPRGPVPLPDQAAVAVSL